MNRILVRLSSALIRRNLRVDSRPWPVTYRSAHFRSPVACWASKHIEFVGGRCRIQSSSSTMPPINGDRHIQQVDDLIKSNQVVVFSKTTCPYCHEVKELFAELNVEVKVVELDEVADGRELHEALASKVGRTSVPQVFINGQHIGGCDDTKKAKDDGLLMELLATKEYDFDLIVVGGGSGGLSASKEAANLGRKVAVVDFVVPSPQGTSWGLGGTCVNVGCIPKKLMHTAALVGQTLKDAYSFGWQTKSEEPFEINTTVQHNWSRMKDEIQSYIKSLNFGYRASLMQNKVKYINAFGVFLDKHTIKVTDKKGKESVLTAEKFIVATGERPRVPEDCVNATQYSISSDDLFSLPYCPGKTLVVGASYVALECAGFLRGLGLDVTVMVRSILLRGFDQEMAEKVGDYMKHEGVKFIRNCVPSEIVELESGQPGNYRVTAKMVGSGEEVVDEYNTVLFAIGRDACTDKIGLDVVGVERNPKNGKIPTNFEQTNVDNIYAIGDVLDGKLELTPVAIEAGMLLARRLYSNSTVQCDYINVPTTVFTPLEYGAVGYSEENAISTFGEDNVDVYVQAFVPLEWRLPHRSVTSCFAKLIVLRNENERVVGFHYVGPNAGEVTQLAGLALKMNATKKDLDALIGIHPTCAEVITTLTVTKRSGQSSEAKDC